MLQASWDEVQQIFARLESGNGVVQVVLRVLEEGEELWEVGDINPSEELLSDPEELKPSEEFIDFEDLEPAEQSEVKISDKNLTRFLDGSVPGTFLRNAAWVRTLPADNFPGGGQECAEYYGGTDLVLHEESLRTYQKSVLVNIAGTPPIARRPVRSKKIADEALSSEETHVLELAMADGEAAAMAKEVSKA